MQIRLHLSTMQKKELSIVDYFNKVKGLVETLFTISQPLQEEEIISYIISGLIFDYDPLVTFVITRIDPISLNDLYAHLVSFELFMEYRNTVFQIDGFSSNLVSCNSHGGCYPSRG